jgi:DNA-binding winged helix-turn-helix (wHTH) protein
MKQPLSDFPGSEPGFAFSNFRLEADGTLRRGDALIHLPPKELAALRLLLAHAGQVVTSQQLRQELWGDVHVTADSVPKCLSSLRERLGPDECIQTVYKRGYRLSVEVRRGVAAPAKRLPRLAIMPFAAGCTTPEHLGFTIAEEAIALLTNAPQPIAALLARDSVFALAQQEQTAQQIGEALQADLVLTGSLRAMPAHFRLRMEMIRIEDGTQIWVEDVLVPKTRVAGLEAELVERLVFRLGGDILSLGGKSGVPGDGSLSQGCSQGGLSISAAATGEHDGEQRLREAHELYQRAHHEWQTLQRHRMQDALQHLTRATELDPSLLAARVDLANLCVTEAFYGFMAPAVAADHVRQAAFQVPPAAPGGLPVQLPGRAQDLSLCAEALLPAFGWISFHVDHDLSTAIEAFALSAHLPHDPWVTRLRVMFALSRDRFEEAHELLQASLQKDPYSPWLHARLAWTLHLEERVAESVDQVRHALDLFPNHGFLTLYGAVILAFNGDRTQSTKLAQGLVQRLPYLDLATAVHAYTLACANRGDEARAILERLQWLGRERFVPSSFTPAVYAALGETETAVAELRKSAEARCPWFFQMLADPRLKSLHAHPEFEKMRAILDRMEAAAAQDLIDPARKNCIPAKLSS